MSREAMQMALEALESDPISHAGLVSRKQAITALRQALVDADDTSQKRVDEKAKREHEPVAYWNTDESSLSFKPGRSGVWVPLYSDPKPCPTCESSNERSDIPMWERAYEQVCEERDAIVKDSNKAYELLRWAETEMRYAKWGTRLNDQHGRTDVYTAIVEFLEKSNG